MIMYFWQSISNSINHPNNALCSISPHLVQNLIQGHRLPVSSDFFYMKQFQSLPFFHDTDIF